MLPEKIELGELIAELYDYFLEKSGDEEVASALTAEAINRLLAGHDGPSGAHDMAAA